MQMELPSDYYCPKYLGLYRIAFFKINISSNILSTL